MFSKNIDPSQPPETPPQPTKSESPKKKETPTPSQQGKFLEALERKEEKKEKKGTTGKTPEEIKKEKNSPFHLVQEKHSQDKEGGEEQGTFSGEGQEEQGFGKDVVPMKGPEEEVVSKVSGKTGPLMPEETAERVAFVHPEKKEGDERAVFPSKGIKEKVFPEGQEKRFSTKAEEPKVTMPPPVQPNEIASTTVQSEVQSTEKSQLVDIVKQTVAAVAEMVDKHESTMVVTLKHPPIFDGASLIIKESVTAQKEFNITFANLSPDARRLIESVTNQEQLRQGLVEKGYVLHMVAIDPNIKNINATETENRSSGEGSPDQEGDSSTADNQPDQEQHQ